MYWELAPGKLGEISWRLGGSSGAALLCCVVKGWGRARVEHVGVMVVPGDVNVRLAVIVHGAAVAVRWCLVEPGCSGLVGASRISSARRFWLSSSVVGRSAMTGL